MAGRAAPEQALPVSPPTGTSRGVALRVGEDVRWFGRTYVLRGLDPMGVAGRKAELEHPTTHRRVRVLARALERENAGAADLDGTAGRANLDLLGWFTEAERHDCPLCGRRTTVRLPELETAFCLGCGSIEIEGERLETEEVARRQYILGAYNRRLALAAANVGSLFSTAARRESPVVLMCTCGRDDCSETVSPNLGDHTAVRLSPHRFVVAPGHANDLDRVLESRTGYDVVEIVPRHRVEDPPTARVGAEVR